MWQPLEKRRHCASFYYTYLGAVFLSIWIFLLLIILLLLQTAIWCSEHQSTDSIFAQTNYNMWITSLDENSESLNTLLGLPFHYILNPKTRCDSRTALLLFIHSAPLNFNLRNAIRETWASEQLQQKFHFKLIFLLGITLPTNLSLEMQIAQEHEKYNDIVRGSFVDTYRNLTHKHVMGLHWSSNFCSQAQFIVKSDDDAFLDMHQVLQSLAIKLQPPRSQIRSIGNKHNYLERLTGAVFSNQVGKMQLMSAGPLNTQLIAQLHIQRSLAQKALDSPSDLNVTFSPQNIDMNESQDLMWLACALFPQGTRTRRHGKWRLSLAELPQEHLPAYCSGLAYIANAKAVQALLKQAIKYKGKPLHIDDLFISGILVAQIAKELHNSNQFLLFDWTHLFNYNSDKLIQWTEKSCYSTLPPLVTDLSFASYPEHLMHKAYNCLQKT